MENHREKLKAADSIAIVRTDKLGDMVLTLPMINAIKDFSPNARIDVIATSYTEVLLKGQKLINKYHLIDKIPGGIDQVFKKNPYDAVFFPRPRLNEIFAGFKYRIPLRIGSGYRWYSFLLNHKVYEHRKTALKNEAQYNVDLVNSVSGGSSKAKLIKPSISTNTELHPDLTSQLSRRGKIIIHPGGGGSAPKWSAENFGELAKMLIKDDIFDIIITGTKEESETAAKVCSISGDGAFNFCGLLNIDEMILLISESKCFIANSTGVLHIAAALGVPIIGFYPNTPSMSSKRWGALTSQAIFLSPPLTKTAENDNLELISPEEAYNSFCKLFHNEL